MRIGARVVRAALMAIVAVCSLAPSVGAQQAQVGVVTNVEGPATIARVALPEPQQIRLKDDVFLQDRITTGDRAIVRVLLGGKATVTARERSIVTITEAPGVSTVHLAAGRIAVAVSKARMNAGEIVEIRTPNAVTAVRGTVVVAEVWPGESVRSTITVLRGLVDVTRRDAGTGRPVGPAVDVAVRQALTVIGATPLSRPTAIKPDEARRLTSEFRIVPTTAPTASAQPAVRAAVHRATLDAEAMVSASSGSGKNASDASGEKATATTAGTPSTTSSGIRSTASSSSSGMGGTSSGNGASVSVAVAAPSANSGKGVSTVSSGTSGSGAAASVSIVVRAPVPAAVPATASTTTAKK